MTSETEAIGTTKEILQEAIHAWMIDPERTLDLVATMRPDRVAAYSFAFVPDARPNQRRLRELPLPLGRELCRASARSGRQNAVATG